MIHHGTQKPYHYEGIIKSIDVDENGNAFLETESVHGEALIKIVIYCNQKIPYWDGSYLQPAELQIGFVIDADFAKQKEGDYYTLKRMVVFPSVLSAKDQRSDLCKRGRIGPALYRSLPFSIRLQLLSRHTRICRGRACRYKNPIFYQLNRPFSIS